MEPVTWFDKDALLRFLFYRMTQDQREVLMRELPGCYNRYVGQTVAVVIRDRDGSAV